MYDAPNMAWTYHFRVGIASAWEGMFRSHAILISCLVLLKTRNFMYPSFRAHSPPCRALYPAYALPCLSGAFLHFLTTKSLQCHAMSVLQVRLCAEAAPDLWIRHKRYPRHKPRFDHWLFLRQWPLYRVNNDNHVRLVKDESRAKSLPAGKKAVQTCDCPAAPKLAIPDNEIAGLGLFRLAYDRDCLLDSV